MKRIDDQQAELISGLVADLNLSVSEAALEKDCHVSSALRALTKIDDPIFEFVFCGGTCLSKSYGIVERLSEDIDIKVIKKPGSPTLSKSEQKQALSGLKAKLQQALIDEGFDAKQFEKDFQVDGKQFQTIKAMDENRFIVFNIRYEALFRPSTELRTQLQIELNFTHTSLPAISRDAVLLIDKLSGKAKPDAVSLKTVDLKEAAVEKLLSFSRRVAMHLRSVEANPETPEKQRKLDHTLVRHIYDIHEIARVEPLTFSDSQVLAGLMATAMEQDASDFVSQHPEFAERPVEELRWALAAVKVQPLFKVQYASFIKNMVYSPSKPDFNSAFDVFERYFNSACETLGDLNFTHFINSENASEKPSRPSCGI